MLAALPGVTGRLGYGRAVRARCIQLCHLSGRSGWPMETPSCSRLAQQGRGCCRMQAVLAQQGRPEAPRLQWWPQSPRGLRHLAELGHPAGAADGKGSIVERSRRLGGRLW